MTRAASHPDTVPRSKPGEPAWEIATLFPEQGHWREGEYLALKTNQLVEYLDGHIEVLPMPTEKHQEIVLFLLEALLGFIRPRRLGKALMAPMRLRLRPNLIREPDILFLLAANQSKRADDYWRGADLVMEVVSPDEESQARDYQEKRREYAAAGIAEYWIVDPQKKMITVLKLAGKRYKDHGVFRPGEKATSPLLEGFEVAVADVFAPNAE